MGFNGSGGFTRVRNWVADATAGIKIRADLHDSEDDGFAAGLSNVICKDGQTVVTADIPMNGKKITNLANPVNPQDAATKATTDGKVAKVGDTMTGDLIISKVSPTLKLDKTAIGQSAFLGYTTNGSARWSVYVDAETGSANVGGDLTFLPCNDAGGALVTALKLKRSTGDMTVGGTVTAGGINATAGPINIAGALAWVSQSYLKTTNSSNNTTLTLTTTILAGGQYGFAPVCYGNVNEGHIAGPLFASNAATPGTVVGTNVSSAATQYFVYGRAATGTVWADQRYVQASPPYDMGDGEIPLFLYALVEKATGYIGAAWCASDPPWANNGPTDIMPTDYREGKAYKRIKDVRLDGLSPREQAMALHEAPFAEVEIDMAMKNADMGLIPHPWISDPNFLSGDFVPVLLDPMSDLMPVLATFSEQRGPSHVLDLVHTDGQPNAIALGNTALKRAGPAGLKIVSVNWR